MDYTVAFYTAGEIAIVLLGICLFLIFHLRGLRKLLRQLEEKVLSLRETVKETKQSARQLLKEAREKIVQVDYVDLIEDQISNTRVYHKQQSPDKDIILDLDVNVSVERQAAALRHAFLVSEKEASYASDEEDEPNWNVLRMKLSQIISFYDHAFKSEAQAVAEETEVDEAEETEVDEAEETEVGEAEETEVGEAEETEVGEAEEAEVDEAEEAEVDEAEETEVSEAEEIEVGEAEETAGLQEEGELDGSDDLAAKNQEVEQLRDLLDDQEKVIEALKKEIDQGSDNKEEDVLVQEMTAEMDKQQQSLLESETCIKSLEDELSAASKEAATLNDEVNKLKAQGADNEEKDALVQDMTAKIDKQQLSLQESETSIKSLEDELSAVSKEAMELNDEVSKLKAQIEDAANASTPAPSEPAAPVSQATSAEEESLFSGFESESRDMLQTISLLEQSNSDLKRQLVDAKEASPSGASTEELEALSEQLTGAQRELSSLQSQHTELEERYIDLKASTM